MGFSLFPSAFCLSRSEASGRDVAQGAMSDGCLKNPFILKVISSWTKITSLNCQTPKVLQSPSLRGSLTTQGSSGRESRVRLTWQAFDSSLHMATLLQQKNSKLQAWLRQSEQYVLSIAWLVFQTKQEMHTGQGLIAEALSTKHEPGLVVSTLPRHQRQALRAPDFRKQGGHTSFTSAATSSFERKPSLATDSSSLGSIKKKLSFGEIDNDEAVTSAAKESASPKLQLRSSPAAASDEPKASAKKPTLEHLAFFEDHS